MSFKFFDKLIEKYLSKKTFPKDQEEELFGPENRGVKRYTFSKLLCIFSDIVLIYSLGLTTYSVLWYFKTVNQAALIEDFSGVLPDLSFLSFLLPSAFALAGLTHTFYYNKERFANVIKIRFEYIKQLLLFKLNSEMYTKEEVEEELDEEIQLAEDEMKGVTTTYTTELENPLENTVI